MGIAADQRNHRRQQILDILSVNPSSMKEIAEAVGQNYYTVRHAMLKMVEDGHISPTNDQRNGSILFQVGRARPMPMVYHKASNTKIALSDVATSYCKNPTTSASTRATLDVGRIAAEMLYLLALSVTPSHPSSSPLNGRNREIAALRTRLTTDVLHIESILGIAKDMLRDETLWSTKELEAVAADSLFDSNRIISEFETALATLDALNTLQEDQT